MDKFVLKSYRPLPRKICNLWEDIQDIIGPVKKWPPKMREMWFKSELDHFQRLKVCAFVFVNGLNPDIFFEWADFFNLLKDRTALRECRIWFQEFETKVWKWDQIYQYNVYHHRYEFINGAVKFYMPLGILHPW